MSVHTPASAGASAEKPSEWIQFKDRRTGFPVTQVTNAPGSGSTHFYFHDPCWTLDSSRLVFRSPRNGRSELYIADMTSGGITQVTNCGSSGGSVSRLTNDLFYWSGREVRSVNLDTFEDRVIGVVPENTKIIRNPTENADGTLIVTVLQTEIGRAIVSVRKSDGEVKTIWETEGGPCHVTCSPVDPNLIMHADSTVPDSEYKERVWMLTTDGKEHWHPYTQTPQEWLTHESWLGNTGKALVCYWPKGITEVNPDGSGWRQIARINAWHAAATPDGTYCVVDTNWTERGLYLIERETGRMRLLCESGSSGGDKGAGEQHPHPSFSPDGRKVVWGSERTGVPEVYVMDIEPALADKSTWFTPEHECLQW